MYREERYVQKIKNDVEEKLYELLTLHLREMDKKISIHAEDNVELKRELVSLLDIAVNDIWSRTNKFNKLINYRHILLISNTILRFYKERQDIKDLKKQIIEDFTHSERAEDGKIPLNYQMNEVRITYDVDYLSYLVQKYIDRKDWIKAMYCFKAVEMLEPDHDMIDIWSDTLSRNLLGKEPRMLDQETPVGKRLAMDSNIAISMISDNIGDYQFRERLNFDRGVLDQNEVFITPSVRDEVHSNVEYRKVKISGFCKKNERFDPGVIIPEFQKRYEGLLERYLVDSCGEDCAPLERVRRFYLQYAPTLVEILDDKMEHYFVSHRLRKLAQREGLLPEEGDMRLLSEVLKMRENGERVDGILSLDKDFTIFSRDILDEFGVEVFMPI